jgi:HK97 family phage major capsid protein
MALAEKEAADKKAAAEAAEKQAAEEAVRNAAVEAGMSGAERLLEEVKKSFDEGRANTQAEIEELKKALQDRSEEVAALQKSKRQFVAQGSNDFLKAHEEEIRDAYLLGAITEKGWNTRMAGQLIEKAPNAFSGVENPDTSDQAVFETTAARVIEKDIENNLILAPLFREVAMQSKILSIPTGEDAGYAAFNPAQNTVAGYEYGDGNLTARDGSAGVKLTQKNLEAQTLVSISFLHNDTDEDSIIPLLPFLNESMARSHARAMENALLMGDLGSNGAVTAGFSGLIKIAVDGPGGATQDTDATGTHLTEVTTAAELLDMRQAMGKYGTRPSDIVYIVNQKTYYDLLDDTAFADVNQVGADLASKIKGQVGNIYGSAVLLCDEFDDLAASKYHAVAVNPRNYVMGRLRGVTLESQYVPRLQHRELIATQRVGFVELFPGTAAQGFPVIARKYAAS